MTILEQISHETMVFMRGKYRLDEIGDGKDELKFKQGQKTIVTIYIHEDKFTFLIIFGKKERECFEMQKSEFSKYICDYYDSLFQRKARYIPNVVSAVICVFIIFTQVKNCERLWKYH